MKHLPKTVKETAIDIVLDLHNSGWFIKQNIADPRFALEFLCDRIMLKYLECCYDLPPKQEIFKPNEFKGIQDRIIQHNILMLMKNKGLVKPVEECNDFKFLLTPKGINNLPYLLNQNMFDDEE
jgi:hypothetical protein